MVLGFWLIELQEGKGVGHQDQHVILDQTCWSSSHIVLIRIYVAVSGHLQGHCHLNTSVTSVHPYLEHVLVLILLFTTHPFTHSWPTTSYPSSTKPCPYPSYLHVRNEGCEMCSFT